MPSWPRAGCNLRYSFAGGNQSSLTTSFSGLETRPSPPYNRRQPRPYGIPRATTTSLLFFGARLQCYPRTGETLHGTNDLSAFVCLFVQHLQPHSGLTKPEPSHSNSCAINKRPTCLMMLCRILRLRLRRSTRPRNRHDLAAYHARSNRIRRAPNARQPVSPILRGLSP